MNKRRTTIRDIAEAAGVSIALVSFVLNNQSKRYRVSEEMSRRIRAIAAELEYQPNNAARSLRSGRSRTIGVIVSDISNKFFADLARCIEDEAYDHNYTVIFGSSDENAVKLENLLNVMIHKGVDGLIVVPCEGADEAVKRVVKLQVPVVLLDRYIPGVEINRVVLDNRKAMTMVVEHLIRKGYRKIEMFSYDMQLSNIQEREQGYLSAMRLAGLEDKAGIRRIRFKHILSDTRDAVARALQEKAEALVFVTNTLTVAGLKALDRYKVHIPEEVAVVGFDGSEAFELYYTSVSYIRQPIEQLGREALELLIQNIETEGGLQAQTITLEPEMVDGNSAGREGTNEK